MHRESITEALLGTVVLFNTVFEIPDEMHIVTQIFSVFVVIGLLFTIIEQVREWEERLKEKSAGRQPRRTNNK